MQRSIRFVKGFAGGGLFGAALCLTAGCGTGGESKGAAVIPAAVDGLSGSVYGGSQPVSGATVQLWAVGTTGYGSTGSVVATTMTNGSGKYSLAGATCSPADELVYVTATGGNPGLQSGTNAQLSLMTALGPCSEIQPTQKIQINEATTVASVFALAQFMNATGNVGSYSANTVGLANAFATVNNLVDTSVGTALTMTPAGNGLAPQAELNTLANILAACVNSAGGAAGDMTACGSLFTAATPSAGSAPTDTVQAALDIALNPGNHAATLYGLAASNAAFQPALSVVPSDWSMAMLFAGAGPTTDDLAIDASGDIWTANQGGNNNGNIAEMLPTGALLAASPYMNGNDGLNAVAIDLSGNAWVTNYYTAEVDEISAGGAARYGPFSLEETSEPQAVAVDGNNNVWVTNYGTDSVSELSNQGAASVALSPSGGYTGGSLNGPLDLAADSLGDVWVTDSGGSSVTKISAAGAVTGYAGNQLFEPSGIAVDAANDVWVTNGTVNHSNVSEVVAFSGSGAQVGAYSPGRSLYLNGSFDAVDGANHVWVANLLNNSVSEMTTSGAVLSPAAGFMSANVQVSATGYSGAAMPAPLEVRIDESGNVWVPNENAVPISGGMSANLTELVGLAAPTVQPLALAVQQSQVGVRPGTPTGVSLAVMTSSLPTAVRGSAYQYQLLAKGGSANGYAWSVTSGGPALANAGLTLSPSGVLSGTVAGVSGGAQVGLAVTDSMANTANAVLTLVIQ